MFFSFLPRRILSLFFAPVLFFPSSCFAFEVSPSVSDLSFSENAGNVTQLISVLNTEVDQKKYEAAVQLVTFAPDGNIAGFADVPDVLGVRVSPEILEVPPGAEQVFTVEFSHPEDVASDEVFGVVIREHGAEDGQLSAEFVALLFPEAVASRRLEASFRIDAFTITSTNDVLQAVAQFTNTGDAVVKPTSLIIARDIFGRELARSVFADHAGRLPVGTTRVVTDRLSYGDFGAWHVGGPVSFSLVSVIDGEDVAQRASVEFVTIPGKGVIAVFVCLMVFCVGGAIFLLRRRGILRS